MISLILAMDKNRVIARDNRIPWHLPLDLAYFKQMTFGHPIIMGRKTFEAIGKPLSGRQNVIITKNKDYQSETCLIFHSIGHALNFCADKDVFVIGGAQIYREFLPYADKLYITLIEANFSGDTFFAEIDDKLWKLMSKIKGRRDELNPFDYYFLTYEKIQPSSN